MHPMASSSTSPDGSPLGPSRLRRRRRLAASALVVGGVLAGISPFLPWVRTDYAALPTYGEPASTVVQIPAASFRSLVLYPGPETIMVVLALGAPIVLVAFGLMALWSGRMLRPRARTAGFVLVVLGIWWTCFQAAITFAVTRLGGFPHTTTLEYGAGVALLGYLCALAGTIWLPTARRK